MSQENSNSNLKNNLYKFPNNISNLKREDIFVIDTPPPTISGQLHIGHVFSYSHTDFIARFQRMHGKYVFYPIGYDDNGLPTEKLVEKKFGKRGRDYTNIEEFRTNCQVTIEQSMNEFKDLFQKIGLSIDFDLQYHTMDKRCKKIATESFIDLYQKGEIYNKDLPVLWDIVDQTAISQAEIEEKEVPGEMFNLEFVVENKDQPVEKWQKAIIATTRPELLPNCRCVFIHPDDLASWGRYAHLKNKWLIAPLFSNRIPILPDDKVIKDKGTGIVMCCLFGDELDLAWWNHYKDYTEEIPQGGTTYKEIFKLKTIITENGMWDISTLPYNGDQKILKLKEARTLIIDLLKKNNLVTQIIPIIQNVKCAERSGAKLEIIPKSQWYVCAIKHKERLLKIIEQINWIPFSMKQKLDSWIENLRYDWCISRQRFWGIKFPVKYLRIVKNENDLDKKIRPGDWIILWDEDNSSDLMKICHCEEEQSEDTRHCEELCKSDAAIHPSRHCEESAGRRGNPLPLARHCEEERSDDAAIHANATPMDLHTTKRDQTLYQVKPNHSYSPSYKIYNIAGEIYGSEILLKENQQFILIDDENVMDTWFTSSSTPEINAALFPENKEKLYPADLRPQAHEIIRTWAFYTILKSSLHHDSIPWNNIMISGWCLAKDGDKMSKSKGNIIDPHKLLDQYGADVVRYWAANSNLGADTKYDENIFKIGKRLITKIENAGKFIGLFDRPSQLSSPASEPNEQGKGSEKTSSPANSEGVREGDLTQNKTQERSLITEIMDHWIIQKLNNTIDVVTDHLEKFDYFKALEAIEKFFWKDFCDNYLEICKVRAYGQNAKVTDSQKLSAINCLNLVFENILKLFAPFVPFVTEKLFLTLYGGQIHERNNWPQAEIEYENQIEIGDIFIQILNEIRKYKAVQQVSMKELIDLEIIVSDKKLLEKMKLVEFDLTCVGNIAQCNLHQKEHSELYEICFDKEKKERKDTACIADNLVIKFKMIEP